MNDESAVKPDWRSNLRWRSSLPLSHFYANADGSPADSAGTCRLVRNAEGLLEPVHEHTDGTVGWWWYEETWTDEYGPFPTRESAEESVKRYAREVLGP